MVQLTHRQRWFIVALTVLVSAWALFVLGIRPAGERIHTLNRVIPQKQKTLEQLRTKTAHYLTLQARLSNLKRQEAALDQKGFELPAFLESITTQLHLAEKVAAMKQELLQPDSDYCETVVEVKLENITLKQLVDFLLKIKSSNRFLRIKSLYTKKNTSNPDLLDTAIQVSALKLNEPI